MAPTASSQSTWTTWPHWPWHRAKAENTIIDAIGPETFTYRELVQTIGENIGVKRPILSMPPVLAYAAGWTVGRLMGDVMITWPEVKGLMADLLHTDSPACRGYPSHRMGTPT